MHLLRFILVWQSCHLAIIMIDLPRDMRFSIERLSRGFIGVPVPLR